MLGMAKACEWPVFGLEESGLNGRRDCIVCDVRLYTGSWLASIVASPVYHCLSPSPCDSGSLNN